MTETDLADSLSPIARRFVAHWGDMGSRWGVNRTVAQIHGLLYFAGRPMHAEELPYSLLVARSNVSMSLRELQNWGWIRPVRLLGDRRDHFDTSRDVWDLFRTVVRERKAREFDPTIVSLRECVNDATFTREEASAKLRVKETLALMEALAEWSDQMLQLEAAMLMRVIKLGAKIRKFVRDA